MKTIFTIALVLFGFTSFAQSNVAVSQGATELAKSKESGSYSFTLPSNVTSEDVKNNAKYYELYFKPEFDASTHKVSIKLTENTERNRFVIARFLSACGVQEVTVDNSNVSIGDFINNYLQ